MHRVDQDEGVEVKKVWVQPGDKVEKEQADINVETEFAFIETPSHADGVIRNVLVRPGDRISRGGVLLSLE